MDTPSDIKLSFACPMKWDDMQKVPGGAYCNQCSNKVFDFTNCDIETYTKAMQESNGNVCGMFRNNQLAPSASRKHFIFQKTIAVVLLFLGLQSCSENMPAKQRPAEPDSNESMSRTLGMIEAPPLEVTDSTSPTPTYVGTDNINAFIKKNLSSPTTLHKKVSVKVLYTVDKNGEIKNISVKNGGRKEINKEAIRVIKLLKFNPAIKGNNAVSSRMVQVVTFTPNN